MKKLLAFFLILSSSMTLASTQSEIKTVMHKYLNSIKTSNTEGIKQVVSNQYFKDLDKNDGLKKLFQAQSNDGKKIEFDMKFQKFHGKENHFLVNIKDKSQKEYDHYWYVIIKKNGKYIIEKEQYLD